MKNIAIIGCGVIAKVLAKAIDSGQVKEVKLSVVYDVELEHAESLAKSLKAHPEVVSDISNIIEDKNINLVIEAASQDAVKKYSVDILESGKDLIAMSVGAFSDDKLLNKVKEITKKVDTRLYIPSGAILGLDGIKAVKGVGIDEVTLTTRKPSSTLSSTKYVIDKGLDLSNLKEPLAIFKGSAGETVSVFPKSVNVAATISLAGIGFDKTKVRVIADPSIDRNIHAIYIKSKAGEFNTESCNIPSPDNPKTSYLAALSAVRTLQNLTESIIIGS